MSRQIVGARAGALVVVALLACAGGATGDVITDEASLVGYWQLDEAAGAPTVADASGNGHTGTVLGGTTLGVTSAMPLLGTAAVFDGVNGKIDVPFSASLNPAQYTAEFFARVDGGAGGYRSPLTSRDDAPQRGYLFYASNLNQWEHWSGPGWDIQGDEAVVTGQWVHIAGTYDGSNKVMYINGHPVISDAGVTVNPNTARPLRIGGGATEGTGTFFFNGAVDNVAIFNQALEHQKIADHYNLFSKYATQVLDDSPVAYYRMGDQALTNANGNVAHNSADVTKYTLGHFNGVERRQFGSGLVGDIDTYFDYNVNTGGGSIYSATAYDAALNPVSFTLELWARVEGSAGAFRAAISSRDDSGGSDQKGYIIYAASDNTWQFWTGNGIDDWHKLTGSAVELNEWTHIVTTFDATSGPNANGAYTGLKSIYIDGELVASIVGLYEPNDVRELRVGAGQNEGAPNFIFDGDLDEVAIYDRALSVEEVRDHYRAALQIPAPGALAGGVVLAVAVAIRRRR